MGPKGAASSRERWPTELRRLVTGLARAASTRPPTRWATSPSARRRRAAWVWTAAWGFSLETSARAPAAWVATLALGLRERFPGFPGGSGCVATHDAQQPVNPYGNVYGQPTVGQSASAKQQAADAVKLPDDLSKDGAGSSGGGGGERAMPAGGVPPYAPYGAMGAYNYMMPPQMAVQVGAEAYGAAYGAYGAAAAAGNGYGGGDGGDYYDPTTRRRIRRRGIAANPPGPSRAARTNPAAMDGRVFAGRSRRFRRRVGE